MRFVSYCDQHRSSWGGVLEKEGELFIVDCCADYAPSLKAALEQDSLSSLHLEAEQATTRLADIRLLPPIVAPEKIICIGVNYHHRHEEYKDGAAVPQYPSVFMRTPDSLTAHEQTILRPPESPQLDYEGEIVVVIGQGGRRIAQADAYQHIAGLSIMNEGTVRDWVRHAKFNVTQGKNFYHSGAWGPWLVTADQFSDKDYENLQVSTRVNGEQRQYDTTANMLFPIAYIIHYLSTFFVLKPGDVIATGTPNGAGARFDPPVYLKPGDQVAVEVSGVGCLYNTVADE